MLGHRKSSKSSENQRLRERKWTQAISQAGASQVQNHPGLLSAGAQEGETEIERQRLL